LTPEARANARKDSAFRPADGWRTDLFAAASQIAAGEAIERDRAEALALAALRAGGALISTAGAVFESDDVTLHARLLALAELAASDLSPNAERDPEASDGRPF
jgi:hypothetical protein